MKEHLFSQKIVSLIFRQHLIYRPLNKLQNHKNGCEN